MFREAHAIWHDGRPAGEGKVTIPSGVLSEASYGFGSLADHARCTTPCEMLAAAIASCMSVVVAMETAKVGISTVNVETWAILTLDNIDGKWQITHASLEIKARTMGGDKKTFDRAIEAARQACPISNALKLDLKIKAELKSLVESAARI